MQKKLFTWECLSKSKNLVLYFAQKKSMQKKRKITEQHYRLKNEKENYTIKTNIRMYLTSNLSQQCNIYTKREFSLQKKDVYYYTSFKDGVAIVR